MTHASGAVIVELLGNGGEPIDLTVADGATIDKGDIIELEDPRKGSYASGSGTAIIGIAAADKVADDGQLNIAVYTHGIFDLTVAAGAAITAGQQVAISGCNVIRAATEAEIAAGQSLGKALEDGTAAEVIEVLVRI